MTPDRPPAEADTPLRIPVLREDLQVSAEARTVGAVRVRVRPEPRPRELPLETATTEVEVQRVAVGRVVDAAVPPWQDGEDWVVPVYEETLVLQRRLVLKEELRLKPRRVAATHTQTVPLWHDVVHIERRDAEGRWTAVDEPEPERHTHGGPAAASSLDP